MYIFCLNIDVLKKSSFQFVWDIQLNFKFLNAFWDLCMYQLGKMLVTAIVSAIFNFFEKHKVDMNAIKIIAIWRSYDGASVMSGNLNGVQSKIKDFYPCAIYTHCMAHRLNVVVVDTCKNIKVSLHHLNL